MKFVRLTDPFIYTGINGLIGGYYKALGSPNGFHWSIQLPDYQDGLNFTSEHFVSFNSWGEVIDDALETYPEAGLENTPIAPGDLSAINGRVFLKRVPKPLEFKVGALVRITSSDLSADHFTSRVGYVGRIIEKASCFGEIYEVEFPELSFPNNDDGSHHTSIWRTSEMEVVPEGTKADKMKYTLTLGGADQEFPIYLSKDLSHATKDLKKAAIFTRDFREAVRKDPTKLSQLISE